MALTSLVDTSVLTRLANPDVRAAVAPLVRLGQVGRCTVSDLEVGYSARNENEWDTMQSALAVFPPIEVISWDIDEAKQTQRVSWSATVTMVASNAQVDRGGVETEEHRR